MKTRLLRRMVVGVAGWLIVVIGIILIPLPGPGLLVVLGGLIILSTEFLWARRYVKMLKRRLSDLRHRSKGSEPDSSR